MNVSTQTTPIIQSIEFDYGVFNNSIMYGSDVTIHTSEINTSTIDEYVKLLKDVFLDYFEHDHVQNAKIEFVFDDGKTCRLPLPYALINLIVWGFVIKTGQTIKPYHVFFNKHGITTGYIKQYIDKYCIIPTREACGENNDIMKIHDLNRVIYDTLRGIKFVDEFAWYFNNTINNEDFVLMYQKCPEFKEIMDRAGNGYYNQFSPEQMNQEALKDMNRLADLIVDAKKYIGRDHCLSDAFRAGEGIKTKQAREAYVAVGVKPNGEGGIFPYVVDSNYINGGATNVAFHILESLIARIAQILSKKNTAKSGWFSRIMILNCSQTKKYTKPYTNTIDPTYDCGTRNFVRYKVDSEDALKKIADRYYRFDPMGMERRTSNIYRVKIDNADLLGQEIYLRSPIKCLSAAKGHGICKKCMGELYSIVPATNIGIYSVTNVTEPLTQMMLSAKHLLEAKINSATFDTSVMSAEDIAKFIMIDEGTIYVNCENPDIAHWRLIIKEEDIQDEVVASLENDEEDSDLDEYEDIRKYINIFYIHDTRTNEYFPIKTSELDNFYMTDWLVEFLNLKNANDIEDDIIIPFSALASENYPLFDIGSIHNDDMSARLESVIKVINLKANTDNYTAETFLETLSNKLNSIGLSNIMSIHLEIIIMNQIRSRDNIIEVPDWSAPNQENYQVLTLKKAIETHPSISISMQSESIAKMLYSPLSLKKTKPSTYDLFYMVQPQVYLRENKFNETNDDIRNNPIFNFLDY